MGRSGRGCDRRLTCELDPRSQRFLTSLILEMYTLRTVPTARAIFKDSVLREHHGVKTMGTEYMTEPGKVSV